jgi:hypothetical protein
MRVEGSAALTLHRSVTFCRAIYKSWAIGMDFGKCCFTGGRVRVDEEGYDVEPAVLVRLLRRCTSRCLDCFQRDAEAATGALDHVV